MDIHIKVMNEPNLEAVFLSLAELLADRDGADITSREITKEEKRHECISM